jgi:hypothetical protein
MVVAPGTGVDVLVGTSGNPKRGGRLKARHDTHRQARPDVGYDLEGILTYIRRGLPATTSSSPRPVLPTVPS